MTDAGLAHVGRLKGVKRLYLSHTRIGDAGLAHLSSLASLEALILDFTQVTGSGLAHLKTLKNLQDITLLGSKVTDAGLAEGVAGLKELQNLKSLALGDTDITDAGLAHLKKVESLVSLHLNHTGITDSGLEHLKVMPNLRWVDLSSTQITDKGLVHLAAMKELAGLRLSHTRYTVDGLKKLGDLPKLKSLDLCGRYQLTLAEAIELLSHPAPPEFAVVTEIDKAMGALTYRVWFAGQVEEEINLRGKKKEILHRPVITSILNRYSLDGPFYDSDGKKLSPEMALKRLAVGSTVLVSTDGKEVHSEYLKIIKKDTVILVPPLAGPGPPDP